MEGLQRPHLEVGIERDLDGAHLALAILDPGRQDERPVQGFRKPERTEKVVRLVAETTWKMEEEI